VIELDRWGQGTRVPACRDYLSRYGVHAKEVLPQLQKLRDNFAKSDVKADKEAVKTLDEIMQNINSSKVSPVILNLKEFMANPTALPKKKK
jgi:DNA-binding transcriptional MocR family regulator